MTDMDSRGMRQRCFDWLRSHDLKIIEAVREMIEEMYIDVIGNPRKLKAVNEAYNQALEEVKSFLGSALKK